MQASANREGQPWFCADACMSVHEGRSWSTRGLLKAGLPAFDRSGDMKRARTLARWKRY